MKRLTLEEVRAKLANNVDIKVIEKFENYAITSDGRVWSFFSNKWLKPEIDARGYARVSLSKDGQIKHKKIHRLVAMAFIPNPHSWPQINHKDENKINNNVENLEWCDAKYNINYGSHNARSANGRKKKVICVESSIIYESVKDAAAELGLNQGNISKVLNGKLITTGGLHFKFWKE